MNRSKPPEPHEPAGIYVHIPFCSRKCPYCDFYSITALDLMQRFVPALKQEMTLVAAELSRFDTVYLGGGTPSLFKAALIDEIIDTAQRLFPIMPAAEITIEVNPGTVTAAELKNYRNVGVNRINIGVQSFQDKNLKFLGRIHTAQEALKAFKMARRAGFNNIGLDLIYAIPGQTKTSWLRDMETAIALEPEHLSAYTLTYEPGTPIYANLEAKRFGPLTDRSVAEMIETTVSYLTGQGYIHYEISNFARSSETRSKHNQKYWSHIPYIGFGPSAHSFVKNNRSWNYSDTERYIDEVESGVLPLEGQEILTEEQRLIETIYLGLRKSEGIDLNRFQAVFGKTLMVKLDEIIEPLREKGYIDDTPGRWALTPEGMQRHESITQYIINPKFQAPNSK